MCRGHWGGSHLLLKGLLLAKITPSLAANCGPAATNKVGGDGGGSQTGGIVMGGRSRLAGSPVSPHLCEDGACRGRPALLEHGPDLARSPDSCPAGIWLANRSPKDAIPKMLLMGFPWPGGHGRKVLRVPCPLLPSQPWHPNLSTCGRAGPSSSNLSTQRLADFCFTLPHCTADLRGHFKSGFGPGKWLQTPHDPTPPPPAARDAAQAKENLSTVLFKRTNQTSP